MRNLSGPDLYSCGYGRASLIPPNSAIPSEFPGLPFLRPPFRLLSPPANNNNNGYSHLASPNGVGHNSVHFDIFLLPPLFPYALWNESGTLWEKVHRSWRDVSETVLRWLCIIKSFIYFLPFISYLPFLALYLDTLGSPSGEMRKDIALHSCSYKRAQNRFTVDRPTTALGRGWLIPYMFLTVRMLRVDDCACTSLTVIQDDDCVVFTDRLEEGIYRGREGKVCSTLRDHGKPTTTRDAQMTSHCFHMER